MGRLPHQVVQISYLVNGHSAAPGGNAVYQAARITRWRLAIPFVYDRNVWRLFFGMVLPKLGGPR